MWRVLGFLVVGSAAGFLGFVLLVTDALHSKPRPLDAASLANMDVAESLFSAHYPQNGARRLPCLAMQRHVTPVGGNGRRVEGWPSGDRPRCGDYLFIQTVAERGKLLGAVACGAIVVGVPRGDRHATNRDVFVARLPGGRPASDYFDPVTGRPQGWATPRHSEDAISDHLKWVRMNISSTTQCDGFELIEISISLRN